MEIKPCLNGLMVYQPAFNEDVCMADFIVKHNLLSKIAAKRGLKTRLDLHLKICFRSGDMYEASEKPSQGNTNININRSSVSQQRKLSSNLNRTNLW